MFWKRIDRKTVYDTKFLKVYEDTIVLPNGTTIDDFSVIEKPNFTMTVATDKDGNIISIEEYKYAINKTIYTLPAGHMEEGEDPLPSAQRELLEETGYSGGDWEVLGEFYDYPTKDNHKVIFLRARNVEHTNNTQHEVTESIKVRVIQKAQLKEEVKKGQWPANATLAALVMGDIFE